MHLKLILFAFFALSACANPTPNELIQNEQTLKDVGVLCSLVESKYTYFEARSTYWQDACDLAREETLESTDSGKRFTALERLLDELYEPHASFGTNTATSPRLVPSGADYWLNFEGNTANIVAIRSGGGAQASGLVVGDIVVALNDISPLDAAYKRIRTGRETVTTARLRWAVNAMAAGYRGKSRRVTIIRGGKQRDFELSEPVPIWNGEHVTARMLPEKVAYLRLNNSLGDGGTIKAFDAALESLKAANSWILDLRDTPSGGNTGIAEPIMARFLTEQTVYQRIIPATGSAYNREIHPRGPWSVSGPLVVIVGRWTGSMGEGMAIGFDGMGRGHVIGSRMARLAGGTEDFILPQSGIQVKLPTYDLMHINLALKYPRCYTREHA
ncbi:MAG: S41 family peptidase [Xanthomonadales bacterium]|nr:S41 family peptidase [Xanthomonadales bacterium]